MVFLPPAVTVLPGPCKASGTWLGRAQRALAKLLVMDSARDAAEGWAERGEQESREQGQLRAPACSLATSCTGTNPDPTGRAMLPAASVTAGHTLKKQKFLKALFTSLQGEKEIAVPLELLHELFVLQEEGDPLVLQVLLPAPLLLQGALAPRGQPPRHGLPAALRALRGQTWRRLGLSGVPAAAPRTQLSLLSLCYPPASVATDWCSPEGSLPLPNSPGQKGQRGTGHHCPLGRGTGQRGWISHMGTFRSSFCRAQAGTDF